MRTVEETVPAATSVRARSAVSMKPAAMLVLATVVWGVSFPLVKDWMNAADAHHFPGGAAQASIVLIGLRMLIASALIGVLFHRSLRQLTRREFFTGFALGVIQSLATSLQNWGMDDTSPALSAFFTSLASPLVPVFAYLLFRTRVARLTIMGLFVGMLGVLVLSMREQGRVALHTGDWITLVSALLFALVILSVAHWGRDARPGQLVLGMLVGTGLPALMLAWITGMAGVSDGWFTTTLHMLEEPAVLLDFALLVLLPTVLGTYWMTTYQPQVSASRAALIYLLEPVFAALASLAWRLDQASIHLLVGGTLIVGGNLLAELPGIVRSRRASAVASQDKPAAEVS